VGLHPSLFEVFTKGHAHPNLTRVRIGQVTKRTQWRTRASSVSTLELWIQEDFMEKKEMVQKKKN